MTTEERLENLERELARAKRRTRRLLAGAVLVLGIGLVVWAFGPDKTLAQVAAGGVKEVRANQFLLVDENGKPRAKLSVDKDGPWLVLADENGKDRAALGVDEDGPRLALLDANGKVRAGLAMDEDGPGLYLYDENDNLRVMVSVDKDGSGLSLSDENGKPRATLAAFAVGSGLNLSDENGKPRAILRAFKDGPRLALSDENGKPRAMLGAFKDGPTLGLIDENGKVIWAAGGADGAATTPRQATPPVKAAPPPPPQSYTCPKCDGRGFLRVTSGGMFGITTARPCPFCRGTGKVTSMPPRRGDETVEEHEAAQRALEGRPPRAVEPAAPAVPSRVEPTAPDTSKSERCPFCGRAGGPTGEIRTVDGYPMRVFMCGQGHEWLKR